MLARAMHAAGLPLEDTTREYSLSIEAQETPLAHYGMAQMLIRKARPQARSGSILLLAIACRDVHGLCCIWLRVSAAYH